MIPYNPIGITDSFPFFCEALVEFSHPPPELEQTFQNLILTYQKCLGQEVWQQYLESFPEGLKTQFLERFKVSVGYDT